MKACHSHCVCLRGWHVVEKLLARAPRDKKVDDSGPLWARA